MAKKVFNMEGGLHSANAFTAFEARAYGSCVASPTSLKVVPASGMTVSVSVGDGIIDGQTPRRVQIDAVENITLTPASTSYARKDLIVAYIDSSVSPTTSVVDNTNNVLKFVAVNGTPSAVPATPSSSEIQAKIGAGNQYMILAEINVDRNAVSILENAISDKRNIITVVPVESLSGKITGSQIESSTIGAGNINFATYEVSTEQEVGTWIDGKKIYRKVVSYTVTSGVVTRAVTHDSTNFTNVDNIVRAEGYFSAGNRKYAYGGVQTSNNGADVMCGLMAFHENNTLTITSISDQSRTNAPLVLAIYYTKK